MKTHQPLTATPAGTHTMVSSMNMLSTRANYSNFPARRDPGNPGGDGDGGDDPGRGGHSHGVGGRDPCHNPCNNDKSSLSE